MNAEHKQDVLKLLTEARELITDPARWTQNVMARNAAGDKVHHCSTDATCWCGLGAMYRVTYHQATSENPVWVKAVTLLRANCTTRMMVTENDSKGHEAMLTAFDRAIIKAKEEEADEQRREVAA